MPLIQHCSDLTPLPQIGLELRDPRLKWTVFPLKVVIFDSSPLHALSQRVYIYQSNRPSAWLTCTRNGVRLKFIFSAYLFVKFVTYFIPNWIRRKTCIPLVKNVLYKQVNLSLLSHIVLIFLKKQVFLIFFSIEISLVLLLIQFIHW